jgi:hypothetical protein
VVPGADETGDPAGTRIAQRVDPRDLDGIMLDDTTRVHLPSAPDGWIFEHETAGVAVPPSLSAAGAIGATGTVVPIVVRPPGTSDDGALGVATERRPRGEPITETESGTAEHDFEHTAWRITVPGI